jgi:hypothetical protein
MTGDSLERAAREWYAAKYKVSIYDQDDWYAAHAADFARDRLDAQRKEIVALIMKEADELVASNRGSDREELCRSGGTSYAGVGRRYRGREGARQCGSIDLEIVAMMMKTTIL